MRTYGKGGFTLLELSIVVALIALVLAVSLPRIMPAILSSSLNGAARRLAGYGRSLQAHCAMVREPVTFKVNLDTGEYWSERWLLDSDDGLFERDTGMFDGHFSQQQRTDSWSQQAYQPLATREEERAQEAREMEEQFQRFARLSVEARARNVRRDGILGDMGPLFEDGMGLQWDDDDEASMEELRVGLLERSVLPDGVEFESVRIGTTVYRTGRAEVVATGLGLSEPVEFVIRSDTEYFTIRWDAITGGTYVRRGVPEVRP